MDFATNFEHGRRERLQAVVDRYRVGEPSRAPERGLIKVGVGQLAALAPHHEAQRAEALLRASDDLGLVSARALLRLFPGENRSSHSVHIRTALAWIGAHLTTT